MEALNKESEFAAQVLTWAQKRSDLRERSTVGKFVRSSLQGLNHEDVLLKLETIAAGLSEPRNANAFSFFSFCLVISHCLVFSLKKGLPEKHFIGKIFPRIFIKFFK